MYNFLNEIKIFFLILKNMETPNFYAIIPADIRYSKELSMFQKLLYAEITALTQKD
jgi:hypothetical protein